MRYALQLYSVVEAMEKDFRETVRHTARIGYDGVEFAGFYGLPPEEVKALLTESALTAARTSLGTHLQRRWHTIRHWAVSISFCPIMGSVPRRIWTG